MHNNIRRLATNLDIKLQAMQQISVASKQQSQIDSVNNLKQCVRSAATILSSTSTMTSMHDQDQEQEIDDAALEIGVALSSEDTVSWVSQQSQNNRQPDQINADVLESGGYREQSTISALSGPDNGPSVGKVIPFPRNRVITESPKGAIVPLSESGPAPETVISEIQLVAETVKRW